MGFENSLKLQAAAAALALRPFISPTQINVMGNLARGEEGRHFLQLFVDLEQRVRDMPSSYDTDGKGEEAVAHLHYFIAGSDWYVTEKDRDDPNQGQVYGYAILNGDDQCAEMGYISLQELRGIGVELDLYWKPITLREIKAARAALADDPPAPRVRG